MKLKILLMLALVLGACSGAAQADDNGVASLTESSTTTATTAADPEAAAMAFTQCMRDNGVDMEDPTVDADGNVIPGRPTNLPDPGEGQQNAQGGPGGEFGEELRSAFEACGDLLVGTTFGFNNIDQTELQDQLLEFAQCLRDQGLEVADPDLSALGGPGGGGAGGGGLFGLDFQEPEVQAAMDACSDLLPNVGGRGFGGGPGGGQGGGQGGATTGDSGTDG
jgi:hypothetical protein